jgi:hypothetical protein
VLSFDLDVLFFVFFYDILRELLHIRNCVRWTLLAFGTSSHSFISSLSLCACAAIIAALVVGLGRHIRETLESNIANSIHGASQSPKPDQCFRPSAQLTLLDALLHSKPPNIKPPSMIVAFTFVSNTCSMLTDIISLSSTTKSALFPGVSDPRSRSAKAA